MGDFECPPGVDQHRVVGCAGAGESGNFSAVMAKVGQFNS